MKMKIPLTPPVGNNNGYYNNGLDYGDHQHHQAVNNLINNSALHQPPPQLNDLGSPRLDPEDFSEYLWMENEEEFDKQVNLYLYIIIILTSRRRVSYCFCANRSHIFCYVCCQNFLLRIWTNQFSF